MRVLVAEDNAPIREAVVQALSENGYAVDKAADGEAALWLARDTPYDAIVLDWMLPKIDGLRVLEQLRALGSQAGVLMLTARDRVEDRVAGLDAGADDYLVKPFAIAELLSRVRALVRRKYDQRGASLRIGPLNIDTRRKAASVGDQQIELTAREYALLEFLAYRAGEVVSRTEIWDHVYDLHSDATSNVVDVYIGYLRRKFTKAGLPEMIRTRRGQGYVLGD